MILWVRQYNNIVLYIGFGSLVGVVERGLPVARSIVRKIEQLGTYYILHYLLLPYYVIVLCLTSWCSVISSL